MGKQKLKALKKKKEWKPESVGLVCLAASFLSLLALSTFSFQAPEKNWLGMAGYLFGLGSSYLFGLASFWIPLYLLWMSIQLLRGTPLKNLISSHIHFGILLASSAFLLTAWAEANPAWAKGWDGKVIRESVHLFTRTLVRYNTGGIPFYFLYADLPWISIERVLSPTGTRLIFGSFAVVSFLLLTQLKIFSHMKTAGQFLWTLYKKALKNWEKRPSSPIKKSLPQAPDVKINLPKEKEPLPSLPQKEILPTPTAKKQFAAKVQKYLPETLKVSSSKNHSLPPLDLLSPAAQKVDQPTLKKDLMRQAAILEETLKSFGIEAKVGEINSGPTITSFEVHPSIGVKVQKIKALENDIALNMEAKSIRIVAPIPGKAAVGVEVPALHPQEVSFREMLEHYQTQAKGKRLQIPILLGKAINGDWVFADLVKTPHMLIAGATGSGKSVCINTLVMAILMNANPSEVKLLMVDPKKVELTQYSSLPHMIAPVITEPHGAYAALQWLVKEMQVRYEILKQLGLRNISAFNHRKKNPELESSLNIPIPEQMPFIVAIIDEFADLMMVSSADIETPIARIAQMARAVGIHLILATQRPSREVITGIIKANIPTRISFKVASRINSQIILDDTGAESLLGNGDLLFLPPGSSQLVRAQGAFLRDEDINQVIQYLTKEAPPNYLIPSFDAFRSLDSGSSKGESEGKDALYDQALNLVLASKTASTTYLQRKLKIGYARAASLIDELEVRGVIGPQEGAKPRRVLSSTAQQPLLLEDEADEQDLV